MELEPERLSEYLRKHPWMYDRIMAKEQQYKETEDIFNERVNSFFWEINKRYAPNLNGVLLKSDIEAECDYTVQRFFDRFRAEGILYDVRITGFSFDKDPDIFEKQYNISYKFMHTMSDPFWKDMKKTVKSLSYEEAANMFLWTLEETLVESINRDLGGPRILPLHHGETKKFMEHRISGINLGDCAP